MASNSESRAALGALLLVTGCIASNAGQREVHSGLEQRLGTSLPALDASAAGRARAQKLLAKPLDAEAAAQVALLQSPRAALALSRLGAGRARAMSLHRWPNPHAELAARFGDADSSPTLDASATLDLTEMVLLGYRVPEGKAELRAAQAETLRELLTLAHAAKRALIVQQANLAAVKLEERVYQTTDATLATTRAMHEAGNTTDLELARQEAAAAESSLRIAAAQEQVKLGQQELLRLLGVWRSETPVQVAAELPPLPAQEPSWLEAEQRALDRNLDMQAAAERKAAADDAASGAWVHGVLPRVGVGVGAEREDDQWSLGPLLEVEVPLFYQGQAERAGAAARAAEAEASSWDAAGSVRADVDQVLVRLGACRQRVQRYETQLLPKRREILRQSLLQYNAMSLGVFALLDAQRALNSSEIAHIVALRDYWLARTDLAQLLAGVSLDGAPSMGLAEPASATAAAAGH